jgi:hypothetical protein
MAMHRVATLVFVLAAASPVPILIGTARAAEPVSPTRTWEGEFLDASLKQAAPKGGLITDAEEFAKLWKAWRKGKAVPAVDFTKQFALVAICPTKGERPVLAAMLQDGALSVLWDSARRGQGGWGYAIATFDRKGVKTVDGLELPPAKDKTEGPKKCHCILWFALGTIVMHACGFIVYGDDWLRAFGVSW